MGGVAARDDRPGAVFDDEDVARCYAQRPPYAAALFEHLLALVPQRRRALDLGCGPGKIAATLADHFAEVVALDAAGPMIAEGRRLHGAPNIRWLHAHVEEADLGGAFDLVTAGTSIHLMDHSVLFPRLVELTPTFAVITGDDAFQPAWLEDWRALLIRWVTRFGGVYDEAAFNAREGAFEAWVDIGGRETFDFSFTQSVADFITCQHSRGTWSRAKMGAAAAREFDADIAATLEPWTLDGAITFDLRSRLVWGTPRRTAQV